MNKTLSILIVEDVESDAALIVRLFEKAGYNVVFERIDSPNLMQAALKAKKWNAVVSDFRMPDFSAVSALSLLKETGIDIPFIVVSGTIGEDTAVAMMKYGAHDYIMKNDLSRLVPAMERELREAEIRRERRRFEAERERLIDELRERNEELRIFSFALSHDLTNPLVAIKGFLDGLKKNIMPDDPAIVQTSIRFISDAVIEMEGLLKDLQNLSRVGHLVQTCESIPFARLAQVAGQMMAEQIRERGIQLTIRKETTELWGDPVRMKQLMLNLLSNSIKFMGDQPRPEIEIGIRHDQNGSVFFIKDNGIGIEPEFHERIFGIFDKLNEEKEGTGMGLAIVKRIIQIHKGRIWVESEGMNKGSVFCFTLPEKTANIQRNDH